MSWERISARTSSVGWPELLDVRGAQPDVAAVRESFGDAAADGAARDPMRAEQDDDFRVAVQGGRVASGPAGRRAARGAPGRHARSFKVRNTAPTWCPSMSADDHRPARRRPAGHPRRPRRRAVACTRRSHRAGPLPTHRRRLGRRSTAFRSRSSPHRFTFSAASRRIDHIEVSRRTTT